MKSPSTYTAGMRRLFLLLAVSVVILVPSPRAQVTAPARNVILITIDGLRWQEFFGGADREYFKRDRNGSGGEPERRFWRDESGRSPALLMPFMWTAVASQGQIFGDPRRNSSSRVTNGLWFSYPGYSEMFVGAADAAIDSNNKVPNPNVTVLEWLNGRPGFRRAGRGIRIVGRAAVDSEYRSQQDSGRQCLAAVAAAVDRSRARDQSTRERLYPDTGATARSMRPSSMRRSTISGRSSHACSTSCSARATSGRTRVDTICTWTRRFAPIVSSSGSGTPCRAFPPTRNQTALIITTDHGRGATTKDWTDHGRDVPAAERTWMAVIGPGVPSLGVRKSINVTTSQIAATMAMLVGEKFEGVTRPAAPAIQLR